MSETPKHTITPLPAVHCGFYREGRCLYEERLNPDYELAWQCQEIVRFGEAYEHFLEQMEHVHLPENEALALWRGRLERMPVFGQQCPDFVFSEASMQQMLFSEASVFLGVQIDCTYADGLVCVLRLPECKGICQHYKLETSAKKG